MIFTKHTRFIVLLFVFLLSACSANKHLSKEEQQQLIETAKIEIADPIFDLIGTSCLHYYEVNKWPSTNAQPGKGSYFDKIYNVYQRSDYFEIEFKLKTQEVDWKLIQFPTTLEDGSEGCSYILTAGEDRDYKHFFDDGVVPNSLDFAEAQEAERSHIANWSVAYSPIDKKTASANKRKSYHEAMTFLGHVLIIGVQVAICVLLDTYSGHCHITY